MKFILYVLVGYLVVDFIVFWGWLFSGQSPIGDVYVGAVTANILNLIF